MRASIRSSLLLAIAAALVAAGAPSAHAAPTDCAIDYDLDLARTAMDFTIFAGLFGAGSSNADLNGDNIVDGFDINTFIAYAGFPVCPWKADYQYNRVIDTVDGIFFQFLFGVGSLRADMDNDGLLTAADVAAFNAVFAATY